MIIDKISLVITGLIIVFSIIINAIKNRKLDYFEPFNTVAIICFLIQVHAPYSWLLENKMIWFGFPVMDNLKVANIYFILGYLSFCFAYFLPKINSKSSMEKKYEGEAIYDMKKLVRVTWVIFGLTFLMYTIYLNLRGRSLLSQLTLGQRGSFSEDIMLNLQSTNSAMWFLKMSLDTLVPCSVILLLFDKKNQILAKITYIVTFLLVISSGWRYLMMIIILGPIILYYLLNNKRPRLIMIVFVVSMLFVFAGYIGGMRSITRGLGGDLVSFDLKDVYKAFMVNIEVFHSYYTAISFIPTNYSYVYGKSYIAIFTMLIPRAIWPGKPVPPGSDMLYSMYGSYAKMGPAIPVWGEYYLNFGLIGIIVGMFIFGRVCKNMHLNLKSNDLMKLVAYSFFVPYLFQYITRGDASGVFVGVLFMFGPIFLIRKLSIKIMPRKQ